MKEVGDADDKKTQWKGEGKDGRREGGGTAIQKKPDQNPDQNPDQTKRRWLLREGGFPISFQASSSLWLLDPIQEDGLILTLCDLVAWL